MDKKLDIIKSLCLVLRKDIVPLIPNDSSKLHVYEEIVRMWIKLFSHNAKHNGIYYAVKENKLLRLAVTRFIAGEPLKGKDLAKSQIGLNSIGLPKKWSILAQLDFSNMNDLRFLLTLLNIPRAVMLEVYPDYSPITSESTGNPNCCSLQEIERALKRLVPRWLRSDNDISFKSFHLSLKTSPSKGPVLPSSVLEARSMTNQPKLLDSISKLSGQVLIDKINICSKYMGNSIDKYFENKKFLIPDCISRVTSIPDKEGKTRNIAILDYWTQTSLNPLNQYIFRILKQIPQDLTFDQGEIPFEQLKRARKVYSYDLASATDRFPLAFQQMVLSFLIGDVKSEAWQVLLTQRDFYVIGKNKKSSTIRYSCGQPMGAFSSWSIFTLSHHVVLHISMQRARVTYDAREFPYRILGDDIIIWDDLVAEQYLKIMTELGVEISPSKSHISERVFELAKRWFLKLNGNIVEITGFPMSGLFSTKNNPVFMASYFKTAFEHGWKDLSTFLIQPDVIKSICQNLGGNFHKDYYKEFRYSLYGVSSVNNVEGFISAFQHLNPFCLDYENKRFKGLVRDCFIVSKMIMLNRDLLKIQLSQLFSEISQMTGVISDWFNSQGQDTSILKGSMFSISEAFPHVQVWNDQVYGFNQKLNDYITAASEYDQYSDVPVAKRTIDEIFDDKSYVAVLTAPDLNRINRLSRNQEVLLTTVKITKSIINILTTTGVESAFNSISSPWEQSWD